MRCRLRVHGETSVLRRERGNEICKITFKVASLSFRVRRFIFVEAERQMYIYYLAVFPLGHVEPGSVSLFLFLENYGGRCEIIFRRVLNILLFVETKLTRG